MRTPSLIQLPVVLTLLLQTPLALADCDCTKFPFKPDPPCQNQCFARLLNESSPGSLKATLGFPETLSNKIESIRLKSGDKPTWHAYERSLTPEEFKTVQGSLAGLNEGKIATLKDQSQLDKFLRDFKLIDPSQTKPKADGAMEATDATPKDAELKKPRS